ncbi:MAG: hypothetical protein AAF517_21105 [Planctomycetota bacterium]
MPDASSRSGDFGGWTALVIFTALSVAMTWPLVLHLDGRIPAGGHDVFQNLWNFWWWKTSFFADGSSPYQTDLIFYPSGSSLAFHTHSEANLFATAPFLLAWGPVVAHNVAIFVGFVLAGQGAFLLAQELGLRPWASLVTGALFAYFPQHVEQTLEHVNLSSYGTMPLVLLGLLRAVETGSWRAWLGTAAAFAVTSLFAWHNGMLIAPMAAFVFVVLFFRTRRPRTRVLIEAAIAGFVSALFVLPFLWPMIQDSLSGAGKPIKGAVSKPADLLFLFVPSEMHGLWGDAVQPLYHDHRKYHSVGFTVYLGWIALSLAAASFVVRDAAVRSARFVSSRLCWSLIFAAYLVISLGGDLLFAGEFTGVPLPFAWLRDAPLFSSVRLAHRFIVPTMLALSILAGFGSDRLLSRFGGRRPSLLGVALVALVCLDFLHLPYPLRNVPNPSWTSHVAEAPKGALLNIPGGYRTRAAEDMFLQSRHGRALLGGYVSVTPKHVKALLEEHPFLRNVYEGRPKVDLPAKDHLPRLLADLPIGVVALHHHRTRERLSARRAQERGVHKRLYNPEKGIPAAKLAEIREVLREEFGEPYYRDEDVELFRRPETAR